MSRHLTNRLAGTTALLLASLMASAPAMAAAFDKQSQIGPDPVLPAPNAYLVPPMHVAHDIGWSKGEHPTVPQGFKIDAIATGLEHPRQPYVLPNGDILVVESNGPGVEPVERPKDLIMGWVQKYAGAGAKGGNRVSILHDSNGDGTYDQKSVFLDGLHSPFGIVLVGHDLYVANTDSLMRYTYHDGDQKITGPGTKVTDLPGGPIDHHWTKSLTASPDGTKLYVGVGSNSNIMENGKGVERERAAVWEVDAKTGAHRIYGSGLRNPNGLTFYPGTDTLWVVVNERDELGPNLVPDYMTSVKDGAFYGWPYSYYGQHVDPRVEPQRPDLVASAIPPDYALSSHVAPLGLTFDTGDSFPTRYKGGAFIGEHGSWDRGDFNGYQVAFVPFANGKPAGKAEPFVTDFLNKDSEARGRPVGVDFDKTGALIVADDLGDTVWRVSAQNVH
ncbi:PQQ-dependent sugar dehydrogenase [Agrobacterium sp. ES01]|uniref:PQQ-dependent sugar dehydrogenase n=1 Tax=Agrobacterium sp. ES01 TaxID=3420714 RepID=UPI003D0C52A2